MRTPFLLAVALLMGCGNPCSDGAAQCGTDGNAEVCIDGQWSLQETCTLDQTCAVEAGVAFCADAPSGGESDLPESD